MKVFNLLIRFIIILFLFSAPTKAAVTLSCDMADYRIGSAFIYQSIKGFNKELRYIITERSSNAVSGIFYGKYVISNITINLHSREVLFFNEWKELGRKTSPVDTNCK